jgi:hypothetical protein
MGLSGVQKGNLDFPIPLSKTLLDSRFDGFMVEL